MNIDNMDSKTARIIISREKGERLRDMLRLFSLTPNALNEWIAQGKGISEDQELHLRHWAAGHFGKVNVGDTGESRYVLLPRDNAPVIMPPGRPCDVKLMQYLTPSAPVGKGRVMGGTVEANNSGKDLPSPDETKMAAARKREAEEAAARQNKPNPVKKVASQVLRHIHPQQPRN